MMKRDLRYSRRKLLKTMGAGAALLPLLHADKSDAACYVGGIKRMYILAWPDGMLSSINSWSAAGNDPATWALADFQKSLAPYQKDLLLLKGVDYSFIKDMPGTGERTGHACFPGMLTGAFYQTLAASTASDLAGGPSVDQYIGSKLQAGGYKGLVSLNQGAFVSSTGHLSWKAAGQVVLPNTDPNSVFNLYFKGALPAVPTAPATPPPGGTPTPAPAPVDNTSAIQKSILDYVLSDLNRFSAIVGTEDRRNIDAHLTSVRNIEMRLQNMTSNTGPSTAVMGAGPISTVTGNAACDVPSTAAEPTPNLTASVPAIVKLHMDLAVSAFASDLTRCVVMQIGDQGAANLILSWLGFAKGGPLASDPNTGDANGFHAIAHENTTRKVQCDTWFQSQIAYIVGQLKSIADPTGKSMLDNSVVVAMNNMRTGTHETTAVPVVMAGSCGGYFKTGRSLALPAGTPNNGLLVALCNAMGTPVSTFGQASYGGELTALKG